MRHLTQSFLFAIVMLTIDLIVLFPLFWFRVHGIADTGGWGYPGPGIMFVNVLLIWLLYIGIFNVWLGGNIGKRIAKEIFDRYV